MKSSRKLAILLVPAIVALSGVTAKAENFVGGAQITPSTTLAPVSNFFIAKISDGITSDAPPFNGFASNSTAGTITLDFDQPYNLDGFVLWNDINVLREGISQFRLDFFDSSLASLGSSSVFLAPKGQVAPATFAFGVVSDAARVNLVVLNSNAGVFNRIEIREVGFLSPVPEPSGAALLSAGLLGMSCLATRRRNRPT